MSEIRKLVRLHGKIGQCHESLNIFLRQANWDTRIQWRDATSDLTIDGVSVPPKHTLKQIQCVTAKIIELTEKFEAHGKVTQEKQDAR